MIHRYLRFPGGKGKALTFSYDDGVEEDIRLIEIFRKNGMRGTFNLNSGQMGNKDIFEALNEKKSYEFNMHQVAHEISI